jgi:LPS-assembly lipoprotein
MWSPDPPRALRRPLRVAIALAIAATAAACFQPLYGDRNVIGGSALRDALASVDVAQINAPKGSRLARIAVETRNELMFDLTGGSGSAPPTHRLTVHLGQTGGALIVDPLTQRIEYNTYGIDAIYAMIEVASGKPILHGTASTRVTYNAPGQQQRFAQTRALRDAETRAAKVIAEMIRNRLASYFVAGT